MILNENINKMKMTKVKIGHTGKKKTTKTGNREGSTSHINKRKATRTWIRLEEMQNAPEIAEASTVED